MTELALSVARVLTLRAVACRRRNTRRASACMQGMRTWLRESRAKQTLCLGALVTALRPLLISGVSVSVRMRLHLQSWKQWTARSRFVHG